MELNAIYEKFKTPSFLNCPVCLDEFHDPRVLPCSHTVCLECINGIMSTSTPNYASRNVSHAVKLRCPLCREEVAVGNARSLPVNRALEDIIEDWKVRVKTDRRRWFQGLLQTCAEHSQDADMWCRTCNVNICKQCTSSVPCNSSQQSPPDHASHEFEEIPNLQSFCEKEAVRLDEWVMVMPTIREMFDIMKMLGAEETQLHRIHDKFLNDLQDLQNEMTNLLSMKISAVATDMNRRLMKLVEHIQSRREQLLKALTELVTKFDALAHGHHDSDRETAQTAFSMSTMNCRQLSSQHEKSHETDVKDMVSDHRRLVAMCVKKVERFRQSVLDVDFQARSLVTLLRHLQDTGANTSNTDITIRPALSHVQITSPNPRPNNNRSWIRFLRSTPPPPPTLFFQPPVFAAPPPNFATYMPPPMNPVISPHQHINHRCCCTCSRPVVPVQPSPVPQGEQEQIRMQNVQAIIPSVSTPLVPYNNQTAPSTADGQSSTSQRPPQQANSGRNSEIFLGGLVVPEPVGDQQRSELVWRLDVQTSETNASVTTTHSETPATTAFQVVTGNPNNTTQSPASHSQEMFQQNNSGNTRGTTMMQTSQFGRTSGSRTATPSPMDTSELNIALHVTIPSMDNEHSQNASASSDSFETSSEGSGPIEHI